MVQPGTTRTPTVRKDGVTTHVWKKDSAGSLAFGKQRARDLPAPTQMRQAGLGNGNAGSGQIADYGVDERGNKRFVPTRLTDEQRARAVASLRSVGGVYDYIALFIEHEQVPDDVPFAEH